MTTEPAVSVCNHPSTVPCDMPATIMEHSCLSLALGDLKAPKLPDFTTILDIEFEKEVLHE